MDFNLQKYTELTEILKALAHLVRLFGLEINYNICDQRVIQLVNTLFAESLDK